jgi:2Fe-2S ferredoxin
MPKVIYIEHGGKQVVANVACGQTVMQGAIGNNVRGIDADCGGECSCATCHVLVAEGWIEVVGPAVDMEESMLEMNPEREANSRLSCQIVVKDALDGLVVHIPEFQM